MHVYTYVRCIFALILNVRNECKQSSSSSLAFIRLLSPAMSARRGYMASSGNQRLQQAAAARRAEAAAVKADPHWIRHLNRNQALNCQIFAYADAQGQLTDNGHDGKIMTDLLAMCTPENEELLNRPAFGISERAGTAAHCMAHLQKHLEKKTTLVNKDLFSSRMAPFFELLPALQVLDGSRPPARSAELVEALQALATEGTRLKGDQRAQTFLQNMKHVGLQLYHTAYALETLLGFLGNPALFREKIGHLDRQDPKIQQWPMSHATDAARMVNFLKASVVRRYGVDAKRKSKAAYPTQDIGSLDSDNEAAEVPVASPGDDDLGLSENDLEPEEPFLATQVSEAEGPRPRAKGSAKAAARKKPQSAEKSDVAELKAQMASLMAIVQGLAQSSSAASASGNSGAAASQAARASQPLDEVTSDDEIDEEAVAAAAAARRKRKSEDAPATEKKKKAKK